MERSNVIRLYVPLYWGVRRENKVVEGEQGVFTLDVSLLDSSDYLT